MPERLDDEPAGWEIRQQAILEGRLEFAEGLIEEMVREFDMPCFPENVRRDLARIGASSVGQRVQPHLFERGKDNPRMPNFWIRSSIRERLVTEARRRAIRDLSLRPQAFHDALMVRNFLSMLPGDAPPEQLAEHPHGGAWPETKIRAGVATLRRMEWVPDRSAAAPLRLERAWKWLSRFAAPVQREGDALVWTPEVAGERGRFSAGELPQYLIYAQRPGSTGCTLEGAVTHEEERKTLERLAQRTYPGTLRVMNLLGDVESPLDIRVSVYHRDSVQDDSEGEN